MGMVVSRYSKLVDMNGGLYSVQKQRLKRERSGLRDRWAYVYGRKNAQKKCGKAYRLNLNTIISTHFEYLLKLTCHTKKVSKRLHPSQHFNLLTT